MPNKPDGLLKRGFAALVLLLAIAFGARLVAAWLAPVVPGIIAVGLLLMVYRLVFRGRRR